MGVIKSLSKYGLAVPVGLGNLVTKGLSKITGKTYGTTTLDEAASTTFGKILGTAIVGTGAALAVAVNPAAAAKAVVPKSILGKGAAVFTSAAAVSSPTLTTAILESPFTLAKAGKKTGEAIEDLGEKYTELPTMGKIPLLAAGIGVAAGVPIVADKIINLFDNKKDKIQDISVTPVPANITPTNEKGVWIEDKSTALPSMATDEAENTPLSKVTTPFQEAYNIEEKPKKATKRKKKKALEPRRQTISQRVNVQVGVNSGNKKYIKNTILIPA